ncbi:MAG: hypothetical protein WDN44_11305 [Sphingomonas sp.]
MRKSIAIVVLLAGCSPQGQTNNGAEADRNAATSAAPSTAAGDEPATSANAQSARKTVERYFALIGQGNYRDARALWGNGGADSGGDVAAFKASFDPFSEYRPARRRADLRADKRWHALCQRRGRRRRQVTRMAAPRSAAAPSCCAGRPIQGNRTRQEGMADLGCRYPQEALRRARRQIIPLAGGASEVDVQPQAGRPPDVVQIVVDPVRSDC